MMNCLTERWGTEMDGQTIVRAVLLNIVLLLTIAIPIVIWRKRQPMTDAKLRKTAEKSAIPTETAPLNDDFVHMHAMLSALDGGVPDERTVTALLLGWALDGQIILCETEKKRLKSFGAAQQATILFPGDEEHPFRPAVSGAEGLLLGLLYGWADETATVQESELYNLAREYHDAVQGRLEQFRTQGRHGLRALGAMLPEKKRRKFGFVDENRPIYTPRGVREATNLLGYRAWLGAQQNLSPGKWRDAVLLNSAQECPQAVDREQYRLAQTLAKALVGGAKAGEKVKHV